MTSGSPAAKNPNNNNKECCMCGDAGLSFELFRCKSCQFRSQHRYCSNLYPKAESYRLCNWCLISEKDNSSNYSSIPCRVKSEGERKIKIHKLSHPKQIDEKIINICKGSSSSPKEIRKGPFKNNNNNQNIITKQKPSTKSPEQSPSLVARKRIAAAGGGIEERLRRTRSESGIVKHVFRNRVRRYKLLEEVSN